MGRHLALRDRSDPSVTRSAVTLRVVHVQASSVDGGDTTLLVVLAGEFDLAAVPAWRSATSELLRDGWTELRLDLREVTFIDSAGVGSLIGLRRRLHDAGGELSLLVSDAVAHTLRAADVEPIFSIGVES